MIKLIRIACGYRLHIVREPRVTFTRDDLAWFRSPVREGVRS